MPLVSREANGEFEALTADGQSQPIRWYGGRGNFSVVGTFGGGEAKLQMSPDEGVNWIDVDRAGDSFVTFSANGEGGFELAPCLLRVSVSGSATPNLFARATSSFAR